jgi:hypothetical protein
MWADLFFFFCSLFVNVIVNLFQFKLMRIIGKGSFGKVKNNNNNNNNNKKDKVIDFVGL